MDKWNSRTRFSSRIGIPYQAEDKNKENRREFTTNTVFLFQLKYILFLINIRHFSTSLGKMNGYFENGYDCSGRCNKRPLLMHASRFKKGIDKRFSINTFTS